MPTPDNLPPRLSDLHGDARLQALYARAAEHRERYRQQFEQAQPTRGLLARLFGR